MKLPLLAVALALAMSVPSAGPSPPEAVFIGPVHEIAEENLLEVIEGAAARADHAAALKTARERARSYLERPPRADGIVAAARSSMRLFDPSVRLAHDIVDAAGNVLFAAGTLINPLKHYPLSSRLLLFDGEDPRQVAFAADMAGAPGVPMKQILVGGSWLQLAREWPTRLYFDQGGAISARLGVYEVPALVEPSGDQLRIRVYAMGEENGE